MQLIQDTAVSICDTVKEAKGQKSDVQIQGDVTAQLNGLVDRLVGAGISGKGILSRSEFEGLTQDATAIALSRDQECRERLFNKMFDRISAAPAIPIVSSAESGWVDGHTYPKEPYCNQQLRARQAQYPDFNIAMTQSEGHRAEYSLTGGKHDVYDYQCLFSAQPK
jgi:hypothetical protein